MENILAPYWIEMVYDSSRYTVTKDGYVIMSSETEF